jgi:hypothetical protein
MRSHFDAEGEIRGTDLLGALVALWREGASGTLQFSRSGATAGFDVAAGDVVRTASSDPRFDTAAILVRAGKLDQATLDRLPVGEGGDRAAVALQTGVLTRREWRWGEKIRAVEVLSDLLTWLEGDYWFFRTGAQDASEFRLTIPRLILELFLRSRDRNLVLHYLGGADVPLARAANFDAEFPSFGLTADAESVVQLIDGERNAAEIASEAPADAFAVEKLLAALVTLGLVHPEFAPGEPGSPPLPAPRREQPAEPEPPEPASPQEAPAPTPAPALTESAAEAGSEREERSLEDEEERFADSELQQGDEDEAEDEPQEEEDDSEARETGRDEEVAEEHADAPRSARGEDDAERDIAGGSFEEGIASARYDDRLDDEEPEPPEDEDEAGLGEHELDRARGRADGGSDRRHAPDDDRLRREAGDDESDLEGRSVRPDTPAGAPADLLGLEEGAAPPESPFERPLDATTGVGMADRPRPKSVAGWVWVLAALAVAVLAVLIWRSREAGPGEGGPTTVAAAAHASPTPILLSATVAPAAAEPAAPSPTPMHIGPTARPTSPSAALARSTAAPAGATAVPTERRAPRSAAATATRSVPTPARPAAAAISPSPRPRSAGASPADSSRQTWVDRAERDRKRYVQQGKARYAVQLELVCEVPSLVDAFQHDRPAGSMWLLAAPFEGRTCFRVLWGRYATRPEAARGLSKAPAFFSTARNHPAVVPVR